MKIKLKSGKVEDVKTGQARRLIQSGEAVEVHEKADDDKHKVKPKPAGAKKDSGADVPGA